MVKMRTTNKGIELPVQGMETRDMDELVRDILPEAMNDDLMSVARAAGMQAALDIMLALGGSTIYVPSAEDFQRRLRDAQIRGEYEGGARVREISRRYGLTERTVYKVLRRQPDRNP